MTYLVLTFGLIFFNHLWKGNVTLVVLVIFRWSFLKRKLTVHLLVLLLKAVKLREGRYTR